jgi:hypothetical protein
MCAGLGIRTGRRRFCAAAAQRHAANGLRDGAAAADGTRFQLRLLVAACAAARAGRRTHGTAEGAARGSAVHKTRIRAAGFSDAGTFDGRLFSELPAPVSFDT